LIRGAVLLRARGEASARLGSALDDVAVGVASSGKTRRHMHMPPSAHRRICIWVGWPSALVANYLATRKSNIHVASHNKVPAHSNVAEIPRAIANAGHRGLGDRVSSSLSIETCVWCRSPKGIAISIPVRVDGASQTRPNGRKSVCCTNSGTQGPMVPPRSPTKRILFCVAVAASPAVTANAGLWIGSQCFTMRRLC